MSGFFFVQALSENKYSTDEESTEDESKIPNEEIERKETKPLSKMGKRTSTRVKVRRYFFWISFDYNQYSQVQDFEAANDYLLSSRSRCC